MQFVIFSVILGYECVMADFYTLQPYIVPEWANMLNHQPKYKVKVGYSIGLTWLF